MLNVIRTTAVVSFPIASLLAACAGDATIRSGPPLERYTTQMNLDDTMGCLIPSLGDTYSDAAASNFRFVGQVIVPNKEYDIVPTDGFMPGIAGGYYIFTVNVAEGETATEVELYRGQPMLPHLTQAMKNGIEACV